MIPILVSIATGTITLAGGFWLLMRAVAYCKEADAKLHASASLEVIARDTAEHWRELNALKRSKSHDLTDHYAQEYHSTNHTLGMLRICTLLNVKER